MGIGEGPAVPEDKKVVLHDARFYKLGAGRASPFLFFAVAVLSGLGSGYKALSRLFVAYPRLPTVYWINSAVRVGVVVFALIAAAKLCFLKKDALTFAKRSLLTLVGFQIFDTLSYLLAGLPARTNKALLEGMPRRVMPLAILACAEYANLAFSKRVRAAFGGIGAAPEATFEPAPAEEHSSKRTVACPQCRQAEDVPSNKIYDTGQYTRFSATAKRRFGFLTLKLTCRSCGKRFTYE